MLRVALVALTLTVGLLSIGAVAPALDVVGAASADHPRACPLGAGSGRPCVPCDNIVAYHVLCHPL